MILDDRDRFRVRNAVLTVTMLAWLLLCIQSIWSPGLPHYHAQHRCIGQDAVSVNAAMDWLLMLAAMMAPILIPSIQFVRGNGLARHRARHTLLFVTGYTTVWMFAGALILRLVAVLDASGFSRYVTVGAAFLIALIWQCSPAKQACLNGCHKLRALAAFGRAADASVLLFGATQGVWCAGSCWAWMLLPLLLSSGHIWAMIAATILIFCERLDEPAPLSWRWRGVGRALRIVVAQVRFRVGVRTEAQRT